MSKFDQVVFIIEDGKIVESKISDYDKVHFIDITTTPLGVAPRMHTRGNELWTWGHCGNFPKLVREYDSNEEAEEALGDCFADDFWNCHEILAFPTREQAEEYLKEIDE